MRAHQAPTTPDGQDLRPGVARPGLVQAGSALVAAHWLGRWASPQRRAGNTAPGGGASGRPEARGRTTSL
jgi:hypothetical protein